MKVFLHRTYRKIYSIVPKFVRRGIAAVDYAYVSRPQIGTDGANEHGLTPGKGAVIFSFDFEMAWSWQYSKKVRDFVAMGLHEREQVPKIVTLMGDYHVPATWATVGHLFLSECKRNSHGIAHPEMPRTGHFESAHTRFSSGDWYQNDPCTSVRSDPAWYAPDLIELILTSPAKNEIASHSFSHLGFGPACTKEAAVAEILECRNVMKSFGVEPVTWIFPDHQNGHYDLLAKNGIEIVRTTGDEKAVVTLPHRDESGLWILETSTMIERGRDWHSNQRLEWLKRLVYFAERHHRIAHVWLHPSISDNSLQQVFNPFVRFVAERRDAGSIDVCTMAGLISAFKK